MRIRIADDSEHDLVQGASYMVETYRDKTWEFLSHIFHWCVPSCSDPRPEDRRIYIFDVKLVKKLIAKHQADEYRRESPGEDVFVAWDSYQANNVTAQQAQALAEADDTQIWEDLRKWL